MGSHSEPGISGPFVVLKDWCWRMWGDLCQLRAVHFTSAALQSVWLGRYWNWPFPPSSSAKCLSLLLTGSQLERKQRHFSIRFTPVAWQQWWAPVEALLKGCLEPPPPIPWMKTGSPSHVPGNHPRPSPLDVPPCSSHPSITFIFFKRKTSLEAHDVNLFLGKTHVFNYHN